MPISGRPPRENKKQDQRIDEMNETMEGFEEISKPLDKTLESFETFINWGLLVNVGTLVWFAGLFDKFILKCESGNEFIPTKSYYFLSIILLGISVLVLVYLRVEQFSNNYQFNKNYELFKINYRGLMALFEQGESAKECLSDGFHYIRLHARLAGNNVIVNAAIDAAEDCHLSIFKINKHILNCSHFVL